MSQSHSMSHSFGGAVWSRSDPDSSPILSDSELRCRAVDSGHG